MSSYPVELICINCERELDYAMPPHDLDEGYTPYNGTIFTSHGHYGSTIFDSMDNSFLQFTLCDICIIEKIEHISLGRKIPIKTDDVNHSKITYEPFEIEESSKKFVYEASESFNLFENLSERILNDGTVVEFIDRIDDENIVISINGADQEVQENSVFEANDGSEYKVDFIHSEEAVLINDSVMVSFSKI